MGVRDVGIDRAVIHRSSVGRRIRRGILAGVLVAGALVAGGGAAASAQTGAGLTGWVSYERFAMVPAPTAPGTGLTQSVPATQTQAGTQGWRLGLTNTTPGVDVTDPAITVDSGWAPSLFPGLAVPTQACPQDVTRQGSAFPFTWTDTANPLPGGPPAPPFFCEINQMLVDDLSHAAFPPSNPLEFTPDVDSSRSLDTTLVLPGGTQELTVRATVHDPSNELVLRSVVFATPETVASVTAPAGLPNCPVPDPGTSPCIAYLNQTGQAAQVTIGHPVPGVEYRFSTVFANNSPDPVNMIPATQVGTTVHRPLTTSTTGNGMHVTDPRLDGSGPGRGAIDFAVGAGQAVEWNLESEVNSIVEYSGGNYAVPTWPPAVGRGHFVIGDLNAAVGDAVTFWGGQWAEDNGLSAGAAPAAFKGFASSPGGAAVCGARWFGHPGDSAGAPETVPSYMPVIVTASVGKSGPAVSGTVTAVAIVRTDPGYAPRPDHPGTGTVVAVLPC